MGVFTRPDSPWYWLYLEGVKKKERLGIRCDASDPDQRKANRAAAEAIYHARLTQIAKSRVGLPSERPRTFSEQAEWFDQHVIATHDSHRAERSILSALTAEFGMLQLTEVRHARLKEYEAAMMEKGRKRSTITRHLNLAKAIVSSAVGEYVEASPLAGYKHRRAKFTPKRTVEATEEPALLTALLERDAELHDLYVVGVGTLLRQENLVTLTRSQYHRGGLVVDTKTGPHVARLDGPTILQTRARDILLARRPATADAPFFPTWAAVFASQEPAAANGRLLRIFRKAVKAAGLPWGLDQDGIVWHTATRATGATRMLRDYGIDIRTVQRMGPWASLDQMAEYLGVTYGNGAGTVHST
jgi:integrase